MNKECPEHVAETVLKPAVAETLELLFLGTGTSTGVPMIGCRCPVCTSADPRNRRRRASLYVRAGELAILIDTPPEFREQALDHEVPRVDAVLYTHAHADHIFGMDDLRRFNTLQHAEIPAYATPEALRTLRRAFGYVDRAVPKGLYRPRIRFHAIDGAFSIGEARITPYDVEHGSDRTIGFRIDWRGRSIGYSPDCLAMDDRAVEGFSGVDVMILDALRHRPHITHMTIAESLRLIERLSPRYACLTHICHDIDHAAEQARLPPGVRLAWDGMRVTV